MAYGGIDFGTKVAIVGVAIVAVVVMRALERYAHIRARKRTQQAIDRVSSS